MRVLYRQTFCVRLTAPDIVKKNGRKRPRIIALYVHVLTCVFNNQQWSSKHKQGPPKSHYLLIFNCQHVKPDMCSLINSDNTHLKLILRCI